MNKIEPIARSILAQIESLAVGTGLCVVKVDRDVLVVTTASRDWYLYQRSATQNVGRVSIDTKAFIVSSKHPKSTDFAQEKHETGWQFNTPSSLAHGFTALAALHHLLSEDLDEFVHGEITRIIPVASQEIELREMNALYKEIRESDSDQIIH